MGRPKGSKNKPKVPAPVMLTETISAAAPVTVSILNPLPLIQVDHVTGEVLRDRSLMDDGVSDLVARRIVLKRAIWDKILAMTEELKEKRGITSTPVEVLAIVIDSGLGLVERGGEPKPSASFTDEEESVSSLKSSLEDSRKEFEDLQAQHAECPAQSTLDTAERKVEELDTEVGELKEEIEKLEIENEELEEKLRDTTDLALVARWAYERGASFADIFLTCASDEARATVQKVYTESVPAMPAECFEWQSK